MQLDSIHAEFLHIVPTDVVHGDTEISELRVL